MNPVDKNTLKISFTILQDFYNFSSFGLTFYNEYGVALLKYDYLFNNPENPVYVEGPCLRKGILKTSFDTNLSLSLDVKYNFENQICTKIDKITLRAPKDGSSIEFTARPLGTTTN